jgi:TonB family protein
MKKNITFLAVIASIGIHGLSYMVVNELPDTPKETKNNVIKMKLAEAPPPPPPPPPPSPPKPEPKPEPVLEPPKPKKVVQRPKIRADERVPPPEKPPPEKQEIRAGLSDSLALPGTGAANAPLAAEGNSAEVAVEPEKAVGTPPPPVATRTEAPEITQPVVPAERDPVSELRAETPASCPQPPGLELSEDALNAGITSGEVTVEVNLDSSGSVTSARLIKGIGYEIDQIVVKTAQRIRCRPAQMNGSPIGIKSKRLSWIIQSS